MIKIENSKQGNNVQLDFNNMKEIAFDLVDWFQRYNQLFCDPSQQTLLSKLFKK